MHVKPNALTRKFETLLDHLVLNLLSWHTGDGSSLDSANQIDAVLKDFSHFLNYYLI